MNNFDNLAGAIAFGNDQEKKTAYMEVWQLAQEAGIYPSSINGLYLARGQGKTSLDFTVPAVNIRGLTYDFTQTILQLAKTKKVGALIFEIARSEIGYTGQKPQEYVGVILAAALKTGWQGPIFIQGDHFQLKPGKVAGQLKEGEIETIKQLIQDAVKAGFYNIDIDASTLVDYSQKEVADQQKSNYQLTAELAKYCRSIQPKGIEISLGGEIGHIGGKNSTPQELEAFMEGFQGLKGEIVGLSKISIQTGTHHGGVVLPDGTLAKVAVDFGVLKNLAQVARKYGLAGTVQHGASTLPADYFCQFPKAEAVEVHLATEFQNIIFDHPIFPKKLLEEMYFWIDQNLQMEKKPGKTDQQFHYELRKKTWGHFKKQIWELPEEVKTAINQSLQEKFTFLFKELKVENTQELVQKFVKTAKLVK